MTGRRRDSNDGVSKIQATLKLKLRAAASLNPGAVTAALRASSALIVGRRRRFRKARHAGRINHHLAVATMSCAFAAHFGLVSQCKMNHAPLAAVHRIE